MLPTFKTSNDIVKFLNSEKDGWCRPMVEEFIEMCGSSIDRVDIEELNGWLCLPIGKVNISSLGNHVQSAA